MQASSTPIQPDVEEPSLPSHGGQECRGQEVGSHPPALVAEGSAVIKGVWVLHPRSLPVAGWPSPFCLWGRLVLPRASFVRASSSQDCCSGLSSGPPGCSLPGAPNSCKDTWDFPVSCSLWRPSWGRCPLHPIPMESAGRSSPCRVGAPSAGQMQELHGFLARCCALNCSSERTRGYLLNK